MIGTTIFVDPAGDDSQPGTLAGPVRSGQKAADLVTQLSREQLCAVDSPPVFDGMAAAGGRLYLSTLDGRLLCLGGKP